MAKIVSDFKSIFVPVSIGALVIVPLILPLMGFAQINQTASEGAQAAPAANAVLLNPVPTTPAPNPDMPQLMIGQPANTPSELPNSTQAPLATNAQKPMTISSPDQLEKAMGIEVPDILKPIPSTPVNPASNVGLPLPNANNAPAPIVRSRPPTAQEIAREIAPNFNVATQYNRLTQCYGTADFMAAFMRIRASRPGATPQVRGVAEQIANMKLQMQPFVLAASTVRTEARFRADYDRVARNISNQIARSANPDPIIQNQLRTLDACSRDIRRWRGGQ